MLNKVGGRKAFGFLLLVAITVAIEFHKESGISTNFMTMMLGLFGVFVSGNVVNKKLTKPSILDGKSRYDDSELRNALQQQMNNQQDIVNHINKLSTSASASANRAAVAEQVNG